MPQVAHAESRIRLWRAGWPNRTRFRPVVAAITTVVLAVGLAAAWLPAQAAVTQSASCLDGGGVRWRSRVIWGGVYQAADGSLRVVLDYVGWTTSKAGTVRTDSVVRTYDGAGVRVQKLKWTGGFDYGLGTVYQVRNPTDPVSAPGRANVTVSLGVDGDWFRNCTVTFTQPSTSSTPAPSTPTPTSAPTTARPSLSAGRSPSSARSTSSASTSRRVGLR